MQIQINLLIMPNFKMHSVVSVEPVCLIRGTLLVDIVHQYFQLCLLP